MKYVIIGTDDPGFVMKKLHERGIIGGGTTQELCINGHLILTNLPSGEIKTCPCGYKTSRRREMERVEAESVPPDGGF